MNAWTILLITIIGGPLDGRTSGLAYPSIEACRNAQRAISVGLGYDHQIACIETTVLSSSIRPKRRPEVLK
jgi:hypothetical protein